ncbi:2-hydroxyacid dehydrogenase [Cryptosporangium sp. NPDC051539]|uniref:2-hydroxyacid dehydrogenase n=1 Tax=Cryptosporangium sp. NPDC051539 TaxID=3363962 RepID=UPI0037A969AB
MKVLQVARLSGGLPSALRERFGARILPEHDREAFLRAHGSDVTVAVTTGVTGVDAGLLAALPRLGAIVTCGVGYDATDLVAARARGVAISNTPDMMNDCVADLTVGLLIDVFRRISASDRYVRAGKWATDGTFPLTRQVTGTRVGIVGLGRIGRAVADRLTGFRCAIRYHNRSRPADVPYPYASSVRQLAADVDALIVTAAGGDASHHLVDRDVLDALGPDGVVINVGRGTIVDEEALVEALVAGRVGGAGLDVYAHEPHVSAALRDHDNVVLTPHIGSATIQSRQAMADLVLRNIEEFLTSGRLVTPIDA